MPALKSTLMKRLSHRIPILQWAPTYTSSHFISDLIAGITVALTVMPQALAYATLAGLEPQYGLYSSFMGCFIYIIFGSCKDITIGPTALMALMTYQQIALKSTDYAILLCLISGIVQFLMAVLHLGVLIDFISIPVTVGFTSATSVIIATSQLKSLLGLKFTSSGFMDTITKVFQNSHKTKAADLTLGVICIILLLLLRKLKDVKIRSSNPKNKTMISRSLWLLSTSRNALVVIGCSVAAYFYERSENGSPFLLTGAVRAGLPELKLPPFSTTVGNRTVEFTEMFTDLGTSSVLVPVIAVLGNVAIAKAFASGKSIDATQELLTLSLSNILGAFFSSMPVTGSFSRSAVNHASGVRTPLGGLFTGILVLLALSFLTPFFAYIPKASLAAVIICAVIFMIEYEVVKPMWKSSKKDLIPTFATFLICLVIGVEIGILIGVAINIVFLLYPSARPSVRVEKSVTKSGVEYISVVLGNSLYFPAMDFVRASVGKAGLSSSHLPVIVDCRYVLGADFTAAKGIASLISDFESRKQLLYFLNPCRDVVSVFKGASLVNFHYVNSEDELDRVLNDFSSKRAFDEEDKLLNDRAFGDQELVRIPTRSGQSTNVELGIE